ncbi:kinetochore scaffold 1 isoform X1 [Cyprinodon tularosa]|uniref:kinetochore scaffold 1 isoform X1 n=1 Tax=Cyprinodon tularosa TaxID=77115 RepID=UPI0018E1EF1B|nr:kinetochore scaffold 1 isoform X1 [Cyprinodon tularosa]
MDDANMDMTGSHTVTIAHGLNLPHQKVDLLPTDSEENVRFRVDDAKKDVAKSRTFKVLSSSNELPPAKENLTKLVSSDATKDVTQSYAVSSVTDSDQKSTQILDSSLANAEAINHTLVDKTRRGTKSILKNQNPESQPSIDIFPKSTEKTLEYLKNVPTMNLTHYLNADAVSDQSLDPLMSDQPITSMRENINDTSSVKETESESCGLDSNPPSSAHNEHAALNSSVFLTSCAQDDTKGDASSCPESNSCPKTEEHDTEKESPSLVSGNAGKSPNKTETEKIGACIGMIEDPMERLVSATDVPPQSMSSKQDPLSKSFKESDLTLENNGALEASKSDELEDVKEQAQTCVQQAMESSPSTADQSPQPSQTSRRKSLADIKSNIRRLSHFINTAPDEDGMETCTAPLPHLDENSKCKTSSPVEPEVEVGSRNYMNDAEAEKPTTAEQPFVAPSMTLSSLKTKQLMSRLSVGGFKPKLPKRKRADQVKKSASDREPTKTFTINATNQLSGEDNICIQDEELLDCEDFSEMIDTTNLENTPTKDSTSNPVFRSQPLEQDVVMEDFMVSSQRQKRSLLESEDYKEDEKRQKMSTELSETAFQTEADSESNVSGIDTQTIDSSNSSPAGSSRSEIAPESTFKHSLFESQLEDYSGDKLTKLEDGTITLLEFFNLLRIDVFIHNCRQSVLPGRLSSSTDKTSLDSLKDKYINHPKQKIYEKDVQSLREKVEGLKYQMQDLGKPLKTVNKSLWEEVLKFTEKEFQSFGAKLKERHNFFRKHSKEQGHEMKEVLYANLVVANLEEQQKLRGKLNQADQMIRSLDECIGELEAELDAVEGKGSEDKPGLTSLQEEMSKVTETLADSERQISELVFENEKKSKDLNRLKSEAKDLQSRNDVLDMINEWRLEENKDTGSVYTFLYKTMFLRLVYEKNTGDDAKSRSEKKMANISFEFNLDEKSYCHARLVHKLVSGYVEGESCWVEKYPTSQHVPQLLREVSLAVGRCRLFGEEIRLLKTWGSLRFDILDLSCSETQVHIVFSSLRKFTKFEVIFEAALTNQSCVFHVQSFKNVIGSTTIQQIEEVVASMSPGRNLFTRIIKKLHQTLLS